MAILKFSASAVAAQIAHARACKTFLPNWNGPVDRPALILIVGNGVHLRSNGIDGTTTRIVTTEQADPSFAFADGMDPFRDTDWMAQRRMAFRDLTGQFYTDILDDVQVLIDRGRGAIRLSTEDLWTCPKSGAVTRIIGLEVTDPVHVLSADDALSRHPDKLPMVNRASGRAGLISARPMQMYDEDIVTLMRKAVRPNGSSYLEETRFGSSAWEEIGKPEFARLWDEEAASLPKTTTTKLYLLTGLLLPIWKDIPTTNERIYRVTPDGATAMIGRTLSEEGAASLRARFLVSNPQTPQEMLTAALGTTAPVDLGRGLTLTRRRVAGEMRLELGGADRGMIDGLKALGCFTEIIAFQLRVFLPHGDGIDTGSILARIVGQRVAKVAEQAA